MNAANGVLIVCRFFLYLYGKRDQVTWQNLKSAMEILRQFNLVLVLDFVDDETWAIEEALGWTQARKQVRPLPHMCV